MTTTVVASTRPVVRRRPSGEPPALRREARWTRWIVVFGAVLLAGAVLHLLARHTGVVDALDRAVTRWFARTRVPRLTNAARSLSALTALAAVMAVRWIAVLVLFVQRRSRHAVVFVTTFVVTDWIVARSLHVELADHAFPSGSRITPSACAPRGDPMPTNVTSTASERTTRRSNCIAGR
jgi:hypothetical protein